MSRQNRCNLRLDTDSLQISFLYTFPRSDLYLLKQPTPSLTNIFIFAFISDFWNAFMRTFFDALFFAKDESRGFD